MHKPTIEAFIMCWNEEKIIRHTLSHYASFCSRITLLDNYSDDGTVEIVKKYFPETGIEKFSTNNQIRDDIYLLIKNNCWKQSKADYVIVCDADEFLYAENMDRQLALLHQHRVALPVISGYNMGSTSFPDDYRLPIYEQVTHGVRNRSFDKQILFSPREVATINYTPGGHTCKPVFRQQRLIDCVVEFKLLHFKYLGKEYLYQRHEAYRQRLSIYNQNNGYGAEYLYGNKHVDNCFENINTHLYKVV